MRGVDGVGIRVLPPEASSEVRAASTGYAMSASDGPCLSMFSDGSPLPPVTRVTACWGGGTAMSYPCPPSRGERARLAQPATSVSRRTGLDRAMEASTNAMLEPPGT